MCDPVSISVASIALMATGTLIQAEGTRRQGQAAAAAGKREQRAAEFSARVTERNALVAEAQSEDILARGRVAEQQQRLRGNLLIGLMRATVGSSGALVGEGTAGALVISQAGINELDALTVRSNFARQALGFDIQAQNLKSQAELTRIAGVNAEISGVSAQQGANLTATGSLLSGGSLVADKWYQFNKLTPPKTTPDPTSSFSSSLGAPQLT